jgi:hypothetical protein
MSLSRRRSRKTFKRRRPTNKRRIRRTKMRFQNGGILSDKQKQEYTALQNVVPTHGTQQINFEKRDESGYPYTISTLYSFKKVPFRDNTPRAIQYRESLFKEYYKTPEIQHIASQLKKNHYYFDFEEEPEIPAF